MNGCFDLNLKVPILIIRSTLFMENKGPLSFTRVLHFLLLEFSKLRWQIMWRNYTLILGNYSRLVEDFVKTLAKDWLPKPELTDSVANSLNGQFSWHLDAKEMLVNEHDSKHNSKTMSVTTFTMNNCPQNGAASLVTAKQMEKGRLHPFHLPLWHCTFN